MSTVTDPPKLSHAERMERLGHANEIRSKRAALKRDLKTGRAELAPLLIDTPEWLELAKVSEMLAAVAAIGPVKTACILRAHHISPSKTVRGLSTRQRACLVADLGARPRRVLSAPRVALGTSQETQHMQALSAANAMRLAQSEIKQRIAAGDRTVASVLAEMPDAARSMTLFDLLAAQFRWGRSRARRMLDHMALPESKVVGTLTERQVKFALDILEYDA